MRGWHCVRRGAGLAADLSEDQIRIARRTYYGLIAELDQAIGEVIAELRNTGELEHTLIVFTSDHGEQLGDHHLFGKLGYFDESFHIPLIIRDPRPQADAARGRVVEAFTEGIDLMPTLLEPPRLPAGSSTHLMPPQKRKVFVPGGARA